MNYIYLLLVVLAGVLLLCIITSRKVLLSPQFGFTVGFFISVTYSLFYIKKWNLVLSIATFKVIGGGVLLFFIVSTIVQLMYKSPTNNLSSKKSMNRVLNSLEISIYKQVDIWKLFIMLCFQLLTLIWLFLFLRRLTGGGFADSIAYYRNSMFSESKMTLPKLLFHARAFCIASSYVWSYLFLSNLMLENGKRKKGKWKYKFLLLCNLLISCVISIMLGGRGGLIQIIIAFIVQLYFLLGERNQWKNVLSLKTVGIVVLIGMGTMLSFQGIGLLIGRTSDIDIGEYIAVYISAEIKNLDTFIREENYGSDIYNNQTFIYLINAFSGKLGLPNWQHDLDLPFRYYGTHPLGNVATVFLPFLYDYGYMGIFLLIPPMAIFSQIVFQHALKSHNTEKHVFPISVIMYSYVFFEVFFSLFSNKFYENIVSTNFIYTLLYWKILQCFLDPILKLKK